MNSASYDYPNQIWYRLGKNSALRRYQLQWSPPYYDSEAAKALMITVSAPIYSENNVFVGLATLDWRVQNVINELTKIRPTPHSFVLLCDPAYNCVLANTFSPEKKESMTGRPLDSIPWYSSISQASKMEVLVQRFRINGAKF